MRDESTDSDVLGRVQELTEALEALDDGPAKETAEQLVGAVVELYGEGLARIMATVAHAPAIVARLADDGVVASLLLVHDLYPVPLETRVLEALDSVRPYMESHGGNVELAALEDGVAHLKLVGHCHGCPASLSTLELAIKDALDERAPDLLGVEVEGLAEPASNGKTPRGPSAPTWLALDDVSGVEPGTLQNVEAGGVELLVANVDGTLLAYRSECPVCGAGLGDASLEGAILSCGRCRHGFSLVEAGRALGSDDVYLEPVPLLRRKGLELSVALAS